MKTLIRKIVLPLLVPVMLGSCGQSGCSQKNKKTSENIEVFRIEDITGDNIDDMFSMPKIGKKGRILINRGDGSYKEAKVIFEGDMTYFDTGDRIYDQYGGFVEKK